MGFTCLQNHMGHVILTSHLLPLIKKTASEGHTVRITNQASNAHEVLLLHLTIIVVDTADSVTLSDDT